MHKICALVALALLLLLQAPDAKAQWPEIPCSVSWLSGPDGMTCLRGPDTEGNTTTGKCVFKRETMFGSHAGGFIYFDLFRNWHDRCWVTGKDARTSFTELQRLAGRVFAEDGPSEWTDVRVVEDAYVSEFVSNRRRCMAFRTYGPPYRGGYAHAINGFACDSPEARAEDAAFTDDEIRSRMTAIKARW